MISTRRFALLILGLLLSAPLPAPAAELDPELARLLEEAAPGRPLPVVLLFAGDSDPAGFPRGRAGAPQRIVAQQALTRDSQARVRALLAERGVSDPRSFWINNSIVLDAGPELIAELLGCEEIALVASGAVPERMIEPQRATSDRTPLWNIAQVRAPEVWDELGLDGSGIVVGSVDSGVDIDHPALAGKWRGGDNSWFDAIAGEAEPYDDLGHGTHTIGTMVGGDGRGPFPYDIGLAYGAQFIAAKVLRADGHPDDISQMFAGMQWMADPDGDPETNDFPHVVNNSWVWGYGSAVFNGICIFWRSVGIVPVFSIGNGGPGAQTTQPPGDYVTTLGVGATTSIDEVALFSARGPSPEGYAWPPDRRKPDLCAPGEGVSSCLPGGGYGAWNGTSMAAPHVAGAVALLLQARPDLDFDALRSLLLDSALDIDDPGYDYSAGYGRLDVYEAALLATGGTAVPSYGTSPLRLAAAPNPFRESVRLRIEGAGAAKQQLEIFDVGGRRLRALERGERDGGAWIWDGRDAAGRRLPAGVYLARLRCEAGAAVSRLLLIR